MAEQRKILRIFKLISLLKGVRRRRPEQLADILEISKRTVYRYFILLEELGFVIDVDFEGCYFIPTEEGEEHQFTFNAEESLLIKQSLCLSFVFVILSRSPKDSRWLLAMLVTIKISQNRFWEIRSKSFFFLAPHSTTKNFVFAGMLKIVNGIPNSLFSFSLLQ